MNDSRSLAIQRNFQQMLSNARRCNEDVTEFDNIHGIEEMNLALGSMRNYASMGFPLPRIYNYTSRDIYFQVGSVILQLIPERNRPQGEYAYKEYRTGTAVMAVIRSERQVRNIQLVRDLEHDEIAIVEQSMKEFHELFGLKGVYILDMLQFTERLNNGKGSPTVFKRLIKV